MKLDGRRGSATKVFNLVQSLNTGRAKGCNMEILDIIPTLMRYIRATISERCKYAMLPNSMHMKIAEMPGSQHVRWFLKVALCVELLGPGNILIW
mmetsp:Transcript_5204/g.11413  ORF Transcript_5204/g.11413 Transcript_5204/m.11413 type:complete len:95 (-) Transcript_5204:211-495(-)